MCYFKICLEIYLVGKPNIPNLCWDWIKTYYSYSWWNERFEQNIPLFSFYMGEFYKM